MAGETTNVKTRAPEIRYNDTSEDELLAGLSFRPQARVGDNGGHADAATAEMKIRGYSILREMQFFDQFVGSTCVAVRMPESPSRLK